MCTCRVDYFPVCFQGLSLCTGRVGLSSHPVLPIARASVCVWRYFDEIGSSCQPLIFRESVVRTCCHDSAYTLSMATRSVRCVDWVDSKRPLPAAAHLRLGEAYRPHLPLCHCHVASSTAVATTSAPPSHAHRTRCLSAPPSGVTGLRRSHPQQCGARTVRCLGGGA